jgi:hypothetical protein
MAGLFTLNSATLGVLDTNVLGGQGTGFVTGSNTSSGTVTGTLGHSGTVTGSNTSTGAVTGTATGSTSPRGYPYRKQVKAAAFVGSASGHNVSSGRVRGSASLSGASIGEMRSTGGSDGRSRLHVRPMRFHAEGFVNSDLSEAEKRRIKDEQELKLIGVL